MESIKDFLKIYGKVSIYLDTNSEESIVILNDKKEVLREINVGGEHEQEKNICLILKNIIGI